MGLTGYMQKQAASFPASIEEYTSREPIPGGHLLEAGITHFDGVPVIRGQKYSTDQVAVKAIHHFRKLLDFRGKFGDFYAKEYVAWFIPHHHAMMKKYPHVFTKKQKQSFLSKIKKLVKS